MFGANHYAKVKNKLDKIVPARRGLAVFEIEVDSFNDSLSEKLQNNIQENWSGYEHFVIIKKLK